MLNLTWCRQTNKSLDFLNSSLSRVSKFKLVYILAFQKTGQNIYTSLRHADRRSPDQTSNQRQNRTKSNCDRKEKQGIDLTGALDQSRSASKLFLTMFWMNFILPLKILLILLAHLQPFVLDSVSLFHFFAAAASKLRRGTFNVQMQKNVQVAE